MLQQLKKNLTHVSNGFTSIQNVQKTLQIRDKIQKIFVETNHFHIVITQMFFHANEIHCQLKHNSQKFLRHIIQYKRDLHDIIDGKL